MTQPRLADGDCLSIVDHRSAMWLPLPDRLADSDFTSSEMSQRYSPAQYDAWYSTPRGRWIGETEFGLLARHVNEVPGAGVIDVGCGTGRFSRRFADAGFNVTGIDIDAASVEFARSKSDGQGSFLVGDARQLAFPDRSFDYPESAALGRVSTGQWPRQLIGHPRQHCCGSCGMWWASRRTSL